MIVLIQILLTAVACLGLWRLWRTLAGRGAASTIVALGFLARASGGQVLFWASWLRLPIARSLQLGDGFWFFALDAQTYFWNAEKILAHGPSGEYPSRIFVQIVAVFIAMFGHVVSIGILINGFAFLLTCAILLRLSPRNHVALTAIAFGPSAILWSLQLLKDTFFVLLIACIVLAWRWWQELWRGPAGPLQIAFCGVAMTAVIYAISSVRWYLGAILWIASCVFFVLVIAGGTRRWRGAAASLVLLAALNQAVRIGSATDLPTPFVPLFDPRVALTQRFKLSQTTPYAEQIRRGYETTPGATTIVPGGALTRVESLPPQQPKAQEKREPAPATETAAPPVTTSAEETAAAETVSQAVTETVAVTPVVEETPPPASTATEPPAVVAMATTAPPPSVPEPVPSTTTVAEPVPEVVTQTTTADPVVAPQPQAPVSVTSTPKRRTEPRLARTVVAAPPPSVPEPVRSTTTVAEPVPEVVTQTTTADPVVAPQPQAPVSVTSTPKRRTEPRSARTVVAAPPPATTTSAPTPEPPPVVTPAPDAEVQASPKQRWLRLATGVAAAVLPRAVAQRIGLVEIGGGRGFWLFAELDTVIFDLLLVYMTVAILRAFRRRAQPTALLILLVLVLVMTAAPLLYIVNNFGTLFRLRLILYAIVAMLTLSPMFRERDADALQ